MRVILFPKIDGIISPARSIIRQLHLGLVNVAPEKKEKFDEEFKDFVLEYLNTYKWVCSVNVKNKHIYLSRKVVEVIWPSSLFYFQAYSEITKYPPGTQIDFASNTALAASSKLMRWAIDSWVNHVDTAWPHGLPAPVQNPQTASDLHIADEPTYCAVAFLLHHELAHIRLRHGGKSEIETEQDTDYSAAAWILDDVPDEQDRRFCKRILGVAIALGTLTANGFHTNYHGGSTHPRNFDRPINTIDRHVQDENHVAWWMVVTILCLHGCNTGRNAAAPDGGFTSARACVEEYANLLSRE